MFTWAELVALYRIHEEPRVNLKPEYNIAPTRPVWILRPDGDRLRLAQARWGLIPSWWKKSPKEMPATFNARAETIAEKPMFRSAFRDRRCIIPASGFYEWTGPRSDRRPFYITRKDGQPMCLAGIWESWRDPESGEEIISAAIIVCQANEFMEEIHNRMPVILEADDLDRWVHEGGHDLLKPAGKGILQAWPVKKNVNSGMYQEPDAIRPWEDAEA